MSNHDWRNSESCECGEKGCKSYMGKRINRYLTDSRYEKRQMTAGVLRAIVSDLEQAGVPDHAYVVRGEGGDAYLFEWEEGQERGKRDE